MERTLRQIVTGLLEERWGGHCALRELGRAAKENVYRLWRGLLARVRMLAVRLSELGSECRV